MCVKNLQQEEDFEPEIMEKNVIISDADGVSLQTKTDALSEPSNDLSPTVIDEGESSVAAVAEDCESGSNFLRFCKPRLTDPCQILFNLLN